MTNYNFPILIIDKKSISSILDEKQMVVTKKSLKGSLFENCTLVDSNLKSAKINGIVILDKIGGLSIFNLFNPLFSFDFELSNYNNISIDKLKLIIKNIVKLDKDFWESSGCPINILESKIMNCNTMEELIKLLFF